MKITPASIPDVLIIHPRKLSDQRGFFSEVFRNDLLCGHGVERDWVQDNHAFSAEAGVLRGFHFQRPPFAQAKLVRVVRGAVLDVALDIRKASPTYGQHVAMELSADNWTQLYVPPGFAHAYVTLSENTEVVYKVTGAYAPAHEGGILWNDPDLTIAWPEGAGNIVSDRDRQWPRLRDLDSPF